MKLTLADNWKTLHRKGTVIFASLCAALTAFGPSIIEAWNMMPPDMKQWLPQEWGRYLAIAAFLLTILIRYTALRRKDKEESNGAS